MHYSFSPSSGLFRLSIYLLVTFDTDIGRNLVQFNVDAMTPKDINKNYRLNHVDLFWMLSGGADRLYEDLVICVDDNHV